MGASYRPDNPFAPKARGGGTRRTYRADNPFAATSDEEDASSLWDRAKRAMAFTSASDPIASMARVGLADVAATVPRTLAALAREGTPGRRWLKDKADAIEAWGAPRTTAETVGKLVTGVGKYAAMGPAAVAVGAAEAAADPRYSQTSLVSKLEGVKRPGVAGSAARAVGRASSKLNETALGRAVGDVLIGEIGGRAIVGAAKGVARGSRAAGQLADRALDRLNPIPDDVVEAATRGGLPASGRLTPERVDEFAREIVQPPQRDPGDFWRLRRDRDPLASAILAAEPQQGPLTLAQTIARAGREASPTFTPRTTPDVSGTVRGRAIEQAEAALDLPTAAQVGELRARRMEVGGPETTELYAIGSTPALLRSAKATAQSPLASAVAGGLVGASVDDDNRLRGAAIGAGLAGGASYLARRAARAGAPLRLTGDADVDQVLGTIARGERATPAKDELLTTAEKAYTKLVDQIYPLRQFGRTVGESEQLSHVATQASGWQQAARQQMDDALRPVLQATQGRREEVMALAKAQRALALADAGLEKTDLPRDVLERTVQKLGAVPEVAAGARQLQDYYRALLDYKHANGVLTDEAYQAIVQSGDVYTPFVREFDDVAGSAPTAGGGRFTNRGTGVRRMDEGRARARTVDPFEQAVLDTMEAYRTVAKQRVSNTLAATVAANDLAAHPFIRRVANQQAGRQGRVLGVNVGGERQYFEVVDDDLYNAWASYDPQQQNILVKLGAPFKRALQTGVTLLPDFAAANALRDNMMTALQYPLRSRPALGGAAVGAGVGAATSEDRGRGALIGAGLGLGLGGLAPNIARTLGAMRSIVRDDEVYKQWLRDGGGGFGGMYPRDAAGARQLIRELERTGVQASDIVNPKRWVDALHYIGQVAERGPRLAAYQDALTKGADAAGAVARSADISLDFSKIGTHTKGVAATTAFWNAKVQGWDKLARLLKSPKTWAQGAAMITAPSVALWAVNQDNPEYWERPQWERNLFWLVPKGGDAPGFWRIPKPFEIGYLFASIPERILDYAHERDPETLAVAMRDMLSTAAEGAVPLLPTAAQPVVENLANHSFFTNRPVVSRPDLAPERQFDSRTSSLAVGLGQATGTSPQQIDNLINGYTGGAGKVVRDVTDRVARRAGWDDRPLPPDRAAIPVVGDLGKRFTTRDTGTSDSEAMFWRRWDRADQAYRTVRDMVADGEGEDAVRTFVRAHADELRAYDALKQTRSELQEVRKAERAVLEDRTIPVDRKRRLQRKLRGLATQLAQGMASGDAEVAQQAR